MVSVLSSREFNQQPGRAKLMAKNCPVIITYQGKPSYVLLNIDDYRKLIASNSKVSELLSMPAVDYFEFEIPKNPRLGWDKVSQKIASVNDDDLVLSEFANESDMGLEW